MNASLTMKDVVPRSRSTEKTNTRKRAETPSARAARVATDPRYQAIRRRDRSFDGVFYFGVETTGVFCRPSCGARLARPEHVSFYSSPADAERAGFRACLRCRPAGPDRAERDATLVAGLCRFIEASDAPPSLEQLASHAGLSPFHVHRVFKAVTGLTPKAWARAHRARRARALMSASGSVSQAIFAAGFSSTSRFSEKSSRTFGMQPKRFQARGAGETIRWAVARCDLGLVLVAATETGLCAIELGDDEETLRATLNERFSAAKLVGGDPTFKATVTSVVALIERPGAMSTRLPLDLRGTAFQERVWRALLDIPPGETRTYSALAEQLGEPGATRAVAAACGQNPLAVAVPCHRVVGKDGSLRGYRWGLSRKRALLGREADR